jgi:hypothetical protein
MGGGSGWTFRVVMGLTEMEGMLEVNEEGAVPALRDGRRRRS